MLQGICVDPGQSVVLEKGKNYFLFPHGPKHFYVSKFPSKESHRGCFSSEYFQLVEKEEWPQEPDVKVISLDPDKVYKARLIWRKKGYQDKQLGIYFIKPFKDHGYFYRDSELKKCGGCFPLHWFTDFVEVDVEEREPEIIKPEMESVELEQILIVPEANPAKYVQLSLFDF